MSDDNDNTDKPLIHDEDVSSYKININNVALENNTGMNLKHDVIAGVQDENDPRPDIEASGIPNDDLVRVPIAGVNDKEQQELENNYEQQQELENATHSHRTSISIVSEVALVQSLRLTYELNRKMSKLLLLCDLG